MKSHPLVKPREGATAESNQDDMAVIRELEPGPERDAAINAMIEANIPLVFAKVNVYISLHPSVEFLQDDLVSEGLVALTLSVRTLADAPTPADGGNCTGFIGNRIVWRMCRLVENFENQQIPEGYVPPGPDVVDPMDEVDARDLLFGACQTPEEVVILEMRERGNTDQEIAERLDISRRAVNMMRHELLERYDEMKRKLQ